MKPENILMDQNFSLKIADFGFSTLIEGSKGDGLCRTKLGTETYMAPEIHQKQPYQGEVVDLFAVGIILFIIKAGSPPFRKASPQDPHYKLLACNRADLFWQSHEKNYANEFFSAEFKDLITSMLQLMPTDRLSMADVVAHPWMKNSFATDIEVKEEGLKRMK